MQYDTTVTVYTNKCTQFAIITVMYEERKNQQDATIRCLLLTSISTCFGHNYAHLQENKEPVTAFGYCTPNAVTGSLFS